MAEFITGNVTRAKLIAWLINNRRANIALDVDSHGRYGHYNRSEGKSSFVACGRNWRSVAEHLGAVMPKGIQQVNKTRLKQ